MKKTLSRKLLVFAVASALLPFGLISSDQWLIIATVYIGMQGVVDGIVKRAK